MDHCLAVKVARARRALRREEQGANLRFECRQRGSSHCESSWCETPSIEGISGSRAPSNGKLPRSMCHRGARDRPRLRARAETPPIGGICGGPGWQYGGDRSHRHMRERSPAVPRENSGAAYVRGYLGAAFIPQILGISSGARSGFVRPSARPRLTRRSKRPIGPLSAEQRAPAQQS